MIKPTSDRVVLKPIQEEEVSASGIILPDTAEKEKPEQGEVIAVGPGKMMDNGQRSSIDVRVGDVVIFTKYGPHEVTINDQEYLIVSESDILGVIN